MSELTCWLRSISDRHWHLERCSHLSRTTKESSQMSNIPPPDWPNLSPKECQTEWIPLRRLVHEQVRRVRSKWIQYSSGLPLRSSKIGRRRHISRWFPLRPFLVLHRGSSLPSPLVGKSKLQPRPFFARVSWTEENLRPPLRKRQIRSPRRVRWREPIRILGFRTWTRTIFPGRMAVKRGRERGLSQNFRKRRRKTSTIDFLSWRRHRQGLLSRAFYAGKKKERCITFSITPDYVTRNTNPE